MRRLIPVSLAAAMFLSVVALVPPRPADAQGAGLISAVLNKMEKNRQDLKSLRSGISMEKYNAQLRDKDSYYGSLVYEPGVGRSANVRLEWQKPQHEILAVFNNEYTLCRPRLNTCYVGKGNGTSKDSKAGSMFRFFSMSGEQLRNQFDVDLKGEDNLGGETAYHLVLQPKTKNTVGFKYAEIWVDGSGMPVMTKVVEKNDDATTVRLTGIERNPNVGIDEFKLQPEKGVQIIRG